MRFNTSSPREIAPATGAVMIRPIASTGIAVALIGNCHTPLAPSPASCTGASLRRTAHNPTLNERLCTLGALTAAATRSAAAM